MGKVAPSLVPEVDVDRAAQLSLVVLLFGIGCRDEPERAPDPTEPVMAVTVAESSAASVSTVCRAYQKELALVQAQKDSAVLDPFSRQKRAALSAVIADVCQ